MAMNDRIEHALARDGAIRETLIEPAGTRLEL
jgi:hypothetical protein